MVSTANREFSFADFREMQSDTGVSYNFQEVVMPFNEELVFLRTYMMAIERVKEELRLAVRITYPHHLKVWLLTSGV